MFDLIRCLLFVLSMMTFFYRSCNFRAEELFFFAELNNIILYSDYFKIYICLNRKTDMSLFVCKSYYYGKCNILITQVGLYIRSLQYWYQRWWKKYKNKKRGFMYLVLYTIMCLFAFFDLFIYHVWGWG